MTLYVNVTDMLMLRTYEYPEFTSITCLLTASVQTILTMSTDINQNYYPKAKLSGNGKRAGVATTAAKLTTQHLP